MEKYKKKQQKQKIEQNEEIEKERFMWNYTKQVN